MSKKLKVTAVSGSPSQPSRTLAIIEEITQRLGKRIPIDLHLIDLGQIGPELAASSNRLQLAEHVQNDIKAIENADLIIVGSHDYNRWERLLLGSVSDSVIHHAPCSVLLVRSK